MLMSGTPSYEQSACKARNLLFASFEARSAGLRMAALNCYQNLNPSGHKQAASSLQAEAHGARSRTARADCPGKFVKSYALAGGIQRIWGKMHKIKSAVPEKSEKSLYTNA